MGDRLVNRGHARRLARAVALPALVLALAATGCGSAPAPASQRPGWEGPVPGSVAVTDWVDDGQPTAPFGSGGPDWGSPEELIRAMSHALASTGNIRTGGGLVERNSSGTVVGWVRMTLDEPDRNVVAGDLRVDMRKDGGSWAVVNVRSRNHCAVQLVGGECR